jgi:regulator of sirC expression with transglutaminase-like and TPR domain
MVLYPADCLAVAVLQPLHELDRGLDVERIVQNIRDIAEGVCERLDSAAAPGDVLFALNDQLFNVLNFHSVPVAGAKPSHSLLHSVLQQRFGEPLSLGIIYICVGRWLGLPLGACDFPGRFLVRYHDDQGGVIIDPAEGGIQLQEADLLSLLMQRFGATAGDMITRGFLSNVDDQHLVVRLLRRLKRAYLNHGEAPQALRVQDKIMQLVPDMPGGFLERGQLYELLGCPRAAAEDYSRYLDLTPDAGDADSLRHRLLELLCQTQVLH